MQHQRVLAPRGYDGPVYNKGGDSRTHITSSVMVSADSKYVSIRLVYRGERGRQKQLQDVPKDGVAGQWQCSVSKSGYVTREVFLEILQDLDRHLTEKGIKRPVILFVDGAGGHLGPSISDYCKEHGIQLRLFRLAIFSFFSLCSVTLRSSMISFKISS